MENPFSCKYPIEFRLIDIPPEYESDKYNSDDYRMVTTLNRDGSAIREVYAKGDYTLTAEYRVANRWAFILSGLILITAIVSLILLLLTLSAWSKQSAK